MNDILKSYLAGLIDGEGCLTIAKQIRKNRVSPAYRISITMSNTDYKLVKIFFDNYGGVVTERKEDRKEWANSYCWYCPGYAVVSFLNDLSPYLISKKRQADLLLNFHLFKKSFKRKSLGQGFGSAPLGNEEIEFREMLYKQVKALNTKGKYAHSLKTKKQ